MPGKIVFTYNLDTGKMTADGQGYKGAACLKMTEKLMQGLNAKVESRKLKAEYNLAQTENRIAVQG